MKISNAITIIALGLQGFLLHADAAPSYRLRGGGSDFDTTDLADDAGYHGYDYGYGEDNPSPSSSSYYPDADGSEDFDDFEMDSPESSVMAGTGAGVYIQGPIEGATRHGTVCRFPFPACGNNSVCRNRAGSRSPICVDNNQCIPPHVRVRNRRQRNRCCNSTPNGAQFCR